MPCRIPIPLDQGSSYPVGLADDRVLTLSEFAEIGIRVQHAHEWLDARASGNLLEA